MRFYSRKILTLVTALSILGVNYFSCSKNDHTVFGFSKEESPLKNDSDVAKMWDLQNAFQKIFELYKDRVVFISTEQSVRLPQYYELFGIPSVQKRTGLGSGFVISEDGFVCTNFHVIAPGGSVVERITVIVEDKSYDAEVRGFDEHKDVAILKIVPKGKLKPVFIGDSTQVKVGDWAIAIGNPFGLSKSFTVGVVSAVGRTNVDEEGESYIQTDAAINPGNSGGPLINIRGEVIGINRMIFSKSGGYMGIGFAIPVNGVKDNLASLQNQKHFQKGFIGIQLLPMTEDIARQLKWPETYGAVVENTLPGGSADTAGLRRGDVIYGANGKKVRSINDLIREIEKSGPGVKIQLDVWRRGVKMKFYLITRAKPAVEN